MAAQYSLRAFVLGVGSDVSSHCSNSIREQSNCKEEGSAKPICRLPGELTLHPTAAGVILVSFELLNKLMLAESSHLRQCGSAGGKRFLHHNVTTLELFFTSEVFETVICDPGQLFMM
jgi:hypothetical protein